MSKKMKADAKKFVYVVFIPFLNKRFSLAKNRS